MSESKAVSLTRLTKVFDTATGPLQVVAEFTLDVRGGELLTLLGPSGSGKTTVLRLVAGLERPSAGAIHIGGVDVTHQAAADRNVGFVFQNYALFPHLNVFDNVAYPLRLRRTLPAVVRSQVDEILDRLGLHTLAGRLPSQLSGGQQQRVALSRALVMQPSVLLFDEPLSNLDAGLRAQVRAEIRRIQRAFGITAIYVTHDQAEAMSLSDRVAVMNAGRIEQVDTPNELYNRPRTVFVATFVGKVNVIPGVIRHADSRPVGMLLGQTFALRSWSGPLNDGGQAVFVIRPERVDMQTPGAGRVLQAEYLGALEEYVVELEGVELIVRRLAHPERAPLAEGDRVGVVIDHASVHAICGAGEAVPRG